MKFHTDHEAGLVTVTNDAGEEETISTAELGQAEASVRAGPLYNMQTRRLFETLLVDIIFRARDIKREQAQEEADAIIAENEKILAFPPRENARA